MGTRWDGKIGKIPKISDKRETKRFSPRLTGSEPDFHDCRQTPNFDEERSPGNGREPGGAELYTPETVSQYKSQWARYQRALSLNPAAIVQEGKNQIYKFESCDSITGFWEVTVVTGASYLNIIKPIFQILCTQRVVLDVIDSDADSFTWTQTRGIRSAELNGVVLTKEQSEAFDFDPILYILSQCFSNGCQDNSPEPIVINVQPEGQPELFDSITIYTTPTSTYYNLSYGQVLIAPDATPCRQVPLNTSPIAPPPRYLQRGYSSPSGSYTFTWNLPSCDVEYLTETIWQVNTTGEYLNVQRFPKDAIRYFTAQLNTHYRVRSVFNVHNHISYTDSQRFYFTSGNALVMGDDTYNNISFKKTQTKINVLPLGRIAPQYADTYSAGISTIKLGNRISTIPLGRKILDLSDSFNVAISFNSGKNRIQKFDLGGVIIR